MFAVSNNQIEEGIVPIENSIEGAKYPFAKVKATSTTTIAAKEVLDGDGTVAAIGSFLAAEIYGLKIMEAGVQDGDNNRTRFVVVSKKDSEKTDFDKTTVIFATEDRPGSLYKILDIFNLWDINMTKIESRPSKKQLGEYFFYVDIIGHIDDDNINDALKMVQKKTSIYKFLGSYTCL